MQPGQRRRRFYIITAAVVLGIIVAAVSIVVYTNYSYVNVEIHGNNEASFVLAYDSTNVTLSVLENATVAVLPNANITITAVVNPSYVVSSWTVTGAEFHSEGNNSIGFLAGSGGGSIMVSISLANRTAGAA